MANYTRPLIEVLEAQLEAERQRQSVGEQIRTARVASGIQQKVMAQSVGISNAYLSQIESGTRTPTVETLSSIVHFFDSIPAKEDHGPDKDQD